MFGFPEFSNLFETLGSPVRFRWSFWRFWKLNDATMGIQILTKNDNDDIWALDKYAKVCVLDTVTRNTRHPSRWVISYIY